MGDIGPARQRYDVLPVPALGIDDIDDWSLSTPRATVETTPKVADEVPDDAPEQSPGWIGRVSRTLR